MYAKRCKGRRNALLVALALCAQLLVTTVTAGHADAAAGPGDDRLSTAPTAWWSYSHVSKTTLINLLSQNNARLTDLQVDDPVAATFTAVMVSNTGSYASGWWWYVGITQSQVSSYLATNQARLITAHAYNTSAGVLWAVVMVSNTGANAKAWWWYYGTTSQLSAQLSAHSARMINVSAYAGSSTIFVGIMVANTGSDAINWWWYVRATVPSINSLLSTNHARPIDLSRNGDGTYNVVMYNSPTRWYWSVNLTHAATAARAAQLGERIIDETSYVVNGTTWVAVLETRNTNTLTEKLWNMIGPVVDSGKYGFYLKQVGGTTLANIGSGVQYEPASALKVLYHAKTIHEESLGSAHDGDAVIYHYNPAAPDDPGICPDNYPSTRTTNLKYADTQMMMVSDNRMTRGVLERFTKTAMLNYATTLGLTSTAINHNIGCPTASTANKTTLVDLGRVYEAYQNGTITTDATWKAAFKSRMLNETNYAPFKTSMCKVVSQEAAKLNKSTATATSFCNAITWLSKGGDYHGGAFPYQVSWDTVNLTGLPFHIVNGTAPRYYIFGEYVDGTTINSQAEYDTVANTRNAELFEAMRPYVNAALATWA